MRARRSSHRLLVLLLLLLGFLATLGGAGARWVDRQLVSTPAWTATSGRLIADPVVRRAVAGYTVRQAFAAGGVPGILDGLQAPARRAEEAFLASPSGRAAWRAANRDTQRNLLAALRPGAGPRGVTLELRPVLAAALGRIADVPGLSRLADALPAGSGRLTILRADQVRPLRGLVGLVRTLAWALPAGALAAFLLALAIASGERRRTLSRIGYRVLVAGGLVLLIRLIAGVVLPRLLLSGSADRAAVRAAWTIGTSQLRVEAIWLLVGGGILAVGSWLLRLVGR